MKKNKRLNKIFKGLLIILFVIYLTIYISQKTGYYEYKNYQKALLTNDQIKSFEEDVKNGKEVNIKDYIVNTNKNYQTNLSKFGLNLSNLISSCINKGINSSFDFLIKFVDE